MYMVELNFRPGISLASRAGCGRWPSTCCSRFPRSIRSAGAPGEPSSICMPMASTRPEIDVDLRPSVAPVAVVLQDIRDHLSGLPGSVYIGQPLTHRINFVMTGLPAQLGGQDLRRRSGYAGEARRRSARPPHACPGADRPQGRNPGRAFRSCRSTSTKTPRGSTASPRRN